MLWVNTLLSESVSTEKSCNVKIWVSKTVQNVSVSTERKWKRNPFPSPNSIPFPYFHPYPNSPSSPTPPYYHRNSNIPSFFWKKWWNLSPNIFCFSSLLQSFLYIWGCVAVYCWLHNHHCPQTTCLCTYEIHKNDLVVHRNNTSLLIQL